MGFTRDQAASGRTVTLEHVPIKALGGQARCLTCRNCNAETGRGIDQAAAKQDWRDLDAAEAAYDMNHPSYRLHRLKGDRRGLWSVRVSGNWRIVFRFVDGEAVDVDLIDYH